MHLRSAELWWNQTDSCVAPLPSAESLFSDVSVYIRRPQQPRLHRQSAPRAKITSAYHFFKKTEQTDVLLTKKNNWIFNLASWGRAEEESWRTPLLGEQQLELPIIRSARRQFWLNYCFVKLLHRGWRQRSMWGNLAHERYQVSKYQSVTLTLHQWRVVVF